VVVEIEHRLEDHAPLERRAPVLLAAKPLVLLQALGLGLFVHERL
jgi:hypothetical protein